jgi:hypothetical protein
MQYRKFEFRDLNNGSVISAPKKDESATKIEQIVTDAVVGALTDNIGLSTDTMTKLDYENVIDPVQELPVIDVELIRGESYQHGYSDAKAQFEPALRAIKEDERLVESLKSKLEAVVPVVDVQEQILGLASKVISAIAKKMHLVIPVDFEGIILGEMMSILNKSYKTGEITIKVHPERIAYCENLIKINALPARIAGNVKIVSEETLGKSDCALVWNETELEYSQDQIIKDADAILEHLNIK